jgi:hypothetical protein
VAPNEIDLGSRPRSTRVVRGIGHVLALLVAAGCIASLVAGPEQITVRLLAGAAGLLILLLYAWVLLTRPHAPARLVVDHEGIRVWNGRGKVIARLAWTELSGVSLMTNEASRRRQVRDARNDLVPWLRGRTISVPIWLELYPADAEAVARHPELDRAWTLGKPRAPGEEQRWLLPVGDGQEQLLRIAEAVRRWRPQVWRGHRAGSLIFGGDAARRAARARRPGSGNA